LFLEVATLLLESEFLSLLHRQNYQISQYPRLNKNDLFGQQRPPEQIVDATGLSGCKSISYTYVEPTIFYDFAYDCALVAHSKGLRNVFVSNGYMSQEVATHMADIVDAINIDIKAFTEDFYKKVCKAKLKPVLNNVTLMHDLGVWVEITTLLIPGLNDSPEEIRSIAKFIKSVDPAMPWHVTAFHPTYKLTDRPRTQVSILIKARQIGLDEGLRFVYEGNIPGEGGEKTWCPACGTELVNCYGFSIRKNKIDGGKCPECSEKIEGLWL
jgi:pyruvate formate lyase activating enzyme